MVQAREDVENLLCITSDYQETRGSQYEKIEISRIITKMLRALEMKRVFRGLELYLVSAVTEFLYYKENFFALKF